MKYDKRKIELKGISPKILGVEFTIAEFQTDVEKVREASELAMALDDYQYLMCKFCNGLGKEDPQWRKYTEMRASTIQVLTDLRVNLAVLKESPTRSNELNSNVEKMKSLQRIDREVIPASQKLLNQEEIRKEEVPEVKPENVSETKMIAQTDEETLGLLVKKLKEHQPSRTSGTSDPDEELVLEIRALIAKSKERYLIEEIKGDDFDEIYSSVFPPLRDFYLKKRYKQIIGGRDASALNGRMAALATQIMLYKQAKDKNQESKIQEYGTDVKYNFNEVMLLLDSIDLSLPLVKITQ